MRRLYIQGLVRTADTVRRDLSRPMSAERKQELRRYVEESLRQVDAILANHGAKLECVPAPTRRAYQFLASLDLDATATVAAPASADSPAAANGSFRLAGVKSYWENVLRRLARASSGGERDELYDSIRSASRNIENYIAEQGHDAGDLTDQSRSIRGWLAFFADRHNFEAYVATIDRARPSFERALGHARRFQPPALLEFRIIPGLYKLRGDLDGTRIILPTPMICFSAELFGAMAEAAFNGGSKQPVMEAASGEEYQSIQAELEALSGAEECTAGVHHDLQASFDRVNGRYFGGHLVCPRLTWSLTFTGRKFGHYDPIRDMVMISSTLDLADVPVFVVDFIMYHELLHKKLGVNWRNGRRAVHTPEFNAEEKLFERYAAAEAAIKKLAIQQR